MARKKARKKLNLLILIAIGFLLIVFLVWRYYDVQENSQTNSIGLKSYNEVISGIPTMTSAESIDNYVSYAIPDGWVKSTRNLSSGGIEIDSPNFRYNSSEGPDQGLKMRISRQKYDSQMELRQYLISEHEHSLHDYDLDLKEVALSGIKGYSVYPYNDGIGFDPKFPNYKVLKDGHLYTIQFLGADGSGLENDVREFLSSIRFR